MSVEASLIGKKNLHNSPCCLAINLANIKWNYCVHLARGSPSQY